MNMRAVTALLVVSLVGCATVAEQPAPTGTSQLTPEEAASAQRAALQGDATMTIAGPNGGDYVGSALIGVHTGDHPWVDLALVGRNTLDPSDNFGGDLVIPNEYAQTLASTGWSFTFARPEPDDQPMLLQGQHLHARLNTMTMHADPNGMFFATLQMTDAETAEARTITVTGRLTGGCDANDGGSVMFIADPTTVPACNSVLGGL